MHCKNFRPRKRSYSVQIALALFIFSFFTFSHSVFAAEIRIRSSASEITPQERFLIDIAVDTENPINVIEGNLFFPDDLLRVHEIRLNTSAINFWIEKPAVLSAGNISFSGGTPGGWSGPDNIIFSVVFEAKNSIGSASLQLANVQARASDGAGTAVPLSIRSTEIYIQAGNGAPQAENIENLADQEPPEYFTPAMAQDASVFNGNKFLVFATQDKISGVNRYEVKESWWTGYRIAENPYVLRNQKANRIIYVKAVDNRGNERIVTYTPDDALRWYQYPELFGIIFLAGLLGSLLKRIWTKKHSA